MEAKKTERSKVVETAYCHVLDCMVSYGGAAATGQHLYDRLDERFDGQSLSSMLNAPGTVVVNRDNIKDYPCLLGKLNSYADGIYLINEEYDFILALVPGYFKTVSEWHCYTVLVWCECVAKFRHWITTYPEGASKILRASDITFSDVMTFFTPSRLECERRAKKIYWSRKKTENKS